MAKQNVSFFERHVEKFVVGVCGAVFLAAAALYLVQTPNTVEVDGEARGPAEFYRSFRDKGEQALNQMRNAKWDPPAEEAKKIAEIKAGLQVRDSGPPSPLPVAFVPPSPPIPEISGASGKRVELAEILAPPKPLVTAGRSRAVTLTPPAIISGSMVPPPPPASSENPKEVAWAAVISSIDRKEQRARFEARGYSETRMGLVIAGIEVQRQAKLANGSWGPEEPAGLWSEAVVQDPPRLQLQEREGGEQVIPPEQLVALDTFIKKFNTYDLQTPLLRSRFQMELSKSQGDWWEWTIPPNAFPSLEGDLYTDYGYQDEESAASGGGGSIGAMPPMGMGPGNMGGPPPGFGGAPNRPAPRPPTGGPGRPGEGPPIAGPGGAAPRPAPGAPNPSQDALNQLRQLTLKAKAAEDKKRYIEAEQLYARAVGLPGVPDDKKKPAQRELERLRPLAEKAMLDRQKASEQLIKKVQSNFGPDRDPIWATDVSIIPGKTYRYRLRLLVLNPYAGLPSYLVKPEQALDVMIPTPWSPWSDPVETRALQRALVTNIADDGKSATVEPWVWTGDKGWTQSGRKKVAVNETIAFPSPDGQQVKYGTVKAIDRNRVIITNAQGEDETHTPEADAKAKADLTKEKQAEDKLRPVRQQLQPNFESTLRTPGGAAPNPGYMGGPPMGMPPMGGPPGGFREPIGGGR